MKQYIFQLWKYKWMICAIICVISSFFAYWLAFFLATLLFLTIHHLMLTWDLVETHHRALKSMLRQNETSYSLFLERNRLTLTDIVTAIETLNRLNARCTSSTDYLASVVEEHRRTVIEEARRNNLTAIAKECQRIARKNAHRPH